MVSFAIPINQLGDHIWTTRFDRNRTQAFEELRIALGPFEQPTPLPAVQSGMRVSGRLDLVENEVRWVSSRPRLAPETRARAAEAVRYLDMAKVALELRQVRPDSETQNQASISITILTDFVVMALELRRWTGQQRT